MSSDFPFAAKVVSPLKCNERPWDLWVSEIGHLSPRRDNDGTFTTPAAVDGKSSSTRRVHEAHPYKIADRGQAHYRRAGFNRLKYESMSLHGFLPQMDNLNAAVCHMCGQIVKCSAAYRHLLESHNGAEPILPPPPPTVKLKSVPSRNRHKKEPPPPPVDIHPIKMETSPVPAAAPLSRIVLPQPDLQYLEEASTSSAITGEVQISMESGELPVVSIQDTEDLPLGENLTDDIFAIMNSEGIQSADDITNAADWKSIIKDIHEINFPSTTDTIQTPDLYAASLDTSLAAYTIPDADLANITLPPIASPMVTVVDNVQNAQVVKAPATPTTKTQSRKTSKTKFNLREYDPNKHCGVVTTENAKPCTRSLTCKAHALSLRRTVEGRAKPFDTLLAEHRASRDAAASGNTYTPPVSHTPAPPVAAAVPATTVNLPPLLVNTSIDLSLFNGLATEQQGNDIYASWLNVEDPVLPDTSSITSLLSQPLPTDSFLLPDDAEIPTEVPVHSIAPPPQPTPPVKEEKPDGPLPLVPSDVCWYSSCPRPLALCTFNASHAGSAITLGKKFATVRSNIKSSLTRSTKTSGVTNNFYSQSSLTKTLHMNSTSKPNKPEVRKLIVTCSNSDGNNDEQQTFSDLFPGHVRHTLNGHLGHSERKSRASSIKTAKRPSGAMLDLGFSFDPLLADEKC